MKGEDADLLVSLCAKIACKTPKITSYVIIYQTQSSKIHSQRAGDPTSQISLTKIAESNIMRDFTTERAK